MVKPKMWQIVLAAAVIGTAWLSVIGGLAESAWTTKPTTSELISASSRLKMPENSEPAPLDVFSKVTFIGAVSKTATRLPMPLITDHFRNQAVKLNWNLKATRDTKNGQKTTYCDGTFAHQIELTQRRDRTEIYAGTYWHSDKSSDLYCR